VVVRRPGGRRHRGGFLGDVLAPRLPSNVREEAVVIGCLIGAAVGATLSFFAFELFVLVLFAAVVGASNELGRLAFQTLMQRLAPEGAHGRVFVRLRDPVPARLGRRGADPRAVPIDFRQGFLILAALYLVAIIGYLTPDILARLRD
jgi:hypothetical protein